MSTEPYTRPERQLARRLSDLTRDEESEECAWNLCLRLVRDHWEMVMGREELGWEEKAALIYVTETPEKED